MRTALNNATLRMYKGDLASPDDVIAAAEQEYKQTVGQ